MFFEKDASMDENKPGTWQEQDHESGRLRFLLDGIGDRIAELHREIKSHAAQMEQMREELDQLCREARASHTRSKAA